MLTCKMWIARDKKLWKINCWIIQCIMRDESLNVYLLSFMSKKFISMQWHNCWKVWMEVEGQRRLHLKKTLSINFWNSVQFVCFFFWFQPNLFKLLITFFLIWCSINCLSETLNQIFYLRLQKPNSFIVGNMLFF